MDQTQARRRLRFYDYVQACTDADDQLHLGTLCNLLARRSVRSCLYETEKPSKWFAFLNKSPERGRDNHCGNEVGTLRRDIEIKPVRNIYRNPATIASLWSEGPYRPYRPIKQHKIK